MSAELQGAQGVPLLETRGLTKRYGGVAALDGVDFEVRQGEVLGVIGPNGAGKSTLVGCLSGILRPTAGSIHLAGQDITALQPNVRAHLGISRTYQIPQPFHQMTVLENLLVAQTHGRRVPGEAARIAAAAILERTGLGAFAHTAAGELSLIRLKRLELARALALRPRLLLLDEVAAGLVPSEIRELMTLIEALRSEVEAILIVEHVLEVIKSSCDRVMVLDWGKKLAEGTSAEVLTNPEVVSVYLGAAAERLRRSTARPKPTAGTAEKPLLRVTGVAAQYGSFRALHRLDLEVGRGEAVALLGSNGAGKTTTARVISGMLAPTLGTVEFEGMPMRHAAPHRVVQMGIAHCMEGRRIFGDLSVEENLQLAGRRASRKELAEHLEQVYRLFPVLHKKRMDSGAALSGGEQQMLAIGRALMIGPKLMIFDEISLGLAPVVVDRLYDSLAEVNLSGVSMIVIEQNVDRGLTLAQRAYVLENGNVALHGTPEELRADPRLQALYVGHASEA